MKSKHPYIPLKRIEAAASDLLAAYGAKFGQVLHPPVPVEEILESYLGLDFGFEDLPLRMGDPTVLGATWVRQREVRIDESLDPTVFPSKEGRYRFTVAHEIGHWELHREPYEPKEGQGALFVAAPSQPQPIICRAGASSEPREWQANRFAAELLMPKEMVMQAWPAVFGKLAPYRAVEELAELSANWALGPDDSPTVEIARKMAQRFNVSGQAMQIRLRGMNLIQTKEPAPELRKT